MPSPLVSIIVPVRNAQDYIVRALNSILSEQDVPLEVVVVDDGSTDSSIRLIQELVDPRLRIVEGTRRGISACLNTGIDASVGSIIMRCDADDLYVPYRIRSQVDWLENNPGFDAVCGTFAAIDADDRFVSAMSFDGQATEITDELRSGVVRTSLCTFSIRSTAVAKAVGFREFFETAEDLDFQFRLSEIGRVYFLPTLAYCYRIHSSSITHSQTNVRRIFFENLAREFRVQRIASGLDDLQRGKPPIIPQATGLRNSAVSHIQDLLIGSAWSLYRGGSNLAAIRTAARAICMSKASWATWKSMCVLLLKICFRRKSRVMRDM